MLNIDIVKYQRLMEKRHDYLHVSHPVYLGVLDILYHKYVDEELYHKEAYCRHPAIARAEYQFVHECVV